MGTRSAHRIITTRWLHIDKKLQFVINPYFWPLKYPSANKSPFFSTEIFSNRSKETMGTWWRIEKLPLDDCISHKVIKSCNLWIIIDLWPLKNPCANMNPNLFLQKCKQQHLDKVKAVKHHGYLLAHQMAATQWLHIYCAYSQKVTFNDFCLTFDP